MKRAIAILAALYLMAGCSDVDGARKALDGAGYTDVRLTGLAWTGCSDSDTFSTGFQAKGPTGKPVEGVVCSGWPKGATIRTF